MPERILVTGASGFLGSRIVARALEAGYPVRALVRTTSDLSLLPTEGIELCRGDVTDSDAVRGAMAGMTAVIHTAGLTPEKAPDRALSFRVNVGGTENVIAACRNAEVRRLVHISSMSAFAQNPSAYGNTKWQADERVRASGLGYTILRPSIIYGPWGRGVFAKMVEQLRKFPVVPVIGNGEGPMRPVHVDDVAWAAVAVLGSQGTVGKTYMLGGKENLTMNEFLELTAEALGKKGRLVHLPVWFCRFLAWAFALITRNPPLTEDNVAGIVLARAVDNSAAEKDFDYRPRGYREGLRESGVR